MPSQKKMEMVEELRSVIQKYTDFFITDYKGMNVSDMTEFRSKLRENGAVYQIIKNNIFKIALENEQIAGLDEVLVGPNAILFAEDPVSAAKVVQEFLKDKKKAEKLQLKAAFTEGRVVDQDYIKKLAELPSKEELLSKLLGTLKNPMNRMVRVLNNPLQKFVFGLKAVSEKK
jgi:large subunit ribosomal protein L10